MPTGFQRFSFVQIHLAVRRIFGGCTLFIITMSACLAGLPGSGLWAASLTPQDQAFYARAGIGSEGDPPVDNDPSIGPPPEPPVTDPQEPSLTEPPVREPEPQIPTLELRVRTPDRTLYGRNETITLDVIKNLPGKLSVAINQPCQKSGSQTDAGEHTVRIGTSDLREGNNDVRICYLTADGQSGEALLTFEADFTPPTLKLDPPAGDLRKTEAITLTCEDSHRCANLILSSEPVADISGTGSSRVITPRSRDRLRVRAEATDEVGNKSSLDVRYDGSQPMSVYAGGSFSLTLGELGAAIPSGFGGWAGIEVPATTAARIPYTNWFFGGLSGWLPAWRAEAGFLTFSSDSRSLTAFGGAIGPSFRTGSFGLPGKIVLTPLLGMALLDIANPPQSALSLTFYGAFNIAYEYTVDRWRPWIALKPIVFADVALPFYGLNIEAGVAYALE